MKQKIDYYTLIQTRAYKDSILKYVNVYRITQEYGGPEEGGWYYSQRWPITSFRGRNKRILKKKFHDAWLKFGNYPNRLGKIIGMNPSIDPFPDHDLDPNDDTGIIWGDDISITVEPLPAFTPGRPYYE